MKRNPIPRMMAKGRSAGRAYDEGARGIQDALVQLLQEKGASGAPNVHMNSMRGDLSRMAGSDAALLALKSVPAVGVLAGLGMKDEEESFANQAMDLLGMGMGAYGIHRGINRLGGTTSAGAGITVGDALRGGASLVGAGLGNIGMDALQGLV